MRTAITVALTICFVCIRLCGNSQQPVLSVQGFEYIWQNVGFAADVPVTKRIIIPSDDSVKRNIQKSFARAIQHRWNIEMPEVSLSIKPLGFSFSGTPRFNTKLKSKEPGTWYLFLQIFDMGNSLLYYHEDDSLTTTLELKCKIVSGSLDSVIFERVLSVNMYREEAPADQVILTRLPSYPAYFTEAFDSIATWLFQPETVSQKSIRLKPACVFIESENPEKPLTQLVFKSDAENIQLLTQPLFSFHMPGPDYEKTNVRRNTGSNSVAGAITLFTGLHISKERIMEYRANFPFETNDSTYHCFIYYAEAESAEREREKVVNSDGSKSYSLHSSSYSLAERHTDSTFLNTITHGSDTLATFRITYLTNKNERLGYTRLWDGSDSATITELPQEWNNSKEENNIVLSGEIKGNSFLMKTVKETTAKEFYINDQLVMIMYGKTLPAKALLFQPLSEQQLKLFTILCSLPYSYFNYTAN